jgi:DNA-binding transcriptional MerR regulator
MSKKRKGRSPSEAAVSQTEAARMLRVTPRTLGNFVRRGVLEPFYVTGSREKHFHVAEVAALADVYGKKLDLVTIAGIATRALAVAKANEHALQDLLRLLRLERKVLGTHPSELGELWIRTEEFLEDPRLPSCEELEDWALTLNAIDETFLALLERHTGSIEPWKPFLDVAQKLAAFREATRAEVSPDFRVAYDMLESARRNLRTVAYFYARQSKSPRTANDLFGTEGVTDKLLALLSSRN